MAIMVITAANITCQADCPSGTVMSIFHIYYLIESLSQSVRQKYSSFIEVVVEA